MIFYSVIQIIIDIIVIRHIVEGVAEFAVNSHFKMKMRGGDISGLTAVSDKVADGDFLADFNYIGGKVTVNGLQSRSVMVDYNIISVGIVVAAVGNNSAVTGINGSAGGHIEVDTSVGAAVIVNSFYTEEGGDIRLVAVIGGPEHIACRNALVLLVTKPLNINRVNGFLYNNAFGESFFFQVIVGIGESVAAVPLSVGAFGVIDKIIVKAVWLIGNQPPSFDNFIGCGFAGVGVGELYFAVTAIGLYKGVGKFAVKCAVIYIVFFGIFYCFRLAFVVFFKPVGEGIIGEHRIKLVLADG